ncbi:hypothetical protein BST61_g10431 [Cercospora zeina]
MPTNTTSPSTTHSTTGGVEGRILPGLVFRPKPNPASSCATGVNVLQKQKKQKGGCSGGGVPKTHRRKKFDLDGLKEGAMQEMVGLEYDDEENAMDD